MENKRIVLANQYILLHPHQGLFYRNKNIFSFAKYTASLQAAFAPIKKYQNQFAQETMAQRLIDGIQVQNNLTITLAKTKFKDENIGNFLGAVSYMATKVNETFRVTKDNKNQVRGGNTIIISEVEGHGRVCGVRGRGHVRDRGQGRGRSNGPFFNAVEFQDFKRHFCPSKMQQVGAGLKSYINQKRTDSNKKRYGDEYRSRRSVKYTAPSHCSNKE